MASRHQRSIETHNYGITFVTSQRGMELPVLDGYVFRCKDKERQRFSCRTKSCRAMLTLNRDEKGVYTVDTPVHTHPPHDTIISTLKRRNVMREAAKKRRTSLVTTRSIATEVRETDSTVLDSVRTCVSSAVFDKEMRVLNSLLTSS